MLGNGLARFLGEGAAVRPLPLPGENNPVLRVDPAGLLGFTLPLNPSGLGGGWQQIPHGDPNGGTRWRSPDGEDGLEFHPGKPGEPGWEGRDHWHRLRPKPNRPGKWEKEDPHYAPGTEVQLKPIPTPYTPAGPDYSLNPQAVGQGAAAGSVITIVIIVIIVVVLAPVGI